MDFEERSDVDKVPKTGYIVASDIFKCMQCSSLFVVVVNGQTVKVTHNLHCLKCLF